MITVILGEDDPEVSFLQLVCKEIPFVQDQRDRCIRKPCRIGDLAKKFERFAHSVDSDIFLQLLVIIRKRNEEEDTVDGVKRMNPLSAFGSLTSDIQDHEILRFVLKLQLRYTSLLVSTI